MDGNGVYQEVSSQDEWDSLTILVLPKSIADVDDMKRAIGLLALFIGLGLSGCRSVSRDEVLRVTSPDETMDAIVYETDCGAVCSFGYEIWIAPRKSGEGEKVAVLEAAMRSKEAWGVNVQWMSVKSVSIEYLQADSARLLKPAAHILDRTIESSFH